MQEIRLHGRGGQGLVKASHLVVKTAVETGHYGQFIPFFGVERKGSPVFGFLRLSEEEIRKYQLRPCEPFETNPFAPADAKICFDFLNHHVCSRNQDMKICRFRHLLPEHPDAIRDRARSM